MSDNRLYYGDNLQVLRDDIVDETIDLIYLDPPFNSNATYNVLFRAPGGEQSQAQIEAFGDTWHWTDEAERAFDEVMASGNTNAAEMLRAMRAFLKENDMMAYLTMMAVRLLELHRVLKPTGSLYLHCDPTASHYLKILLDAAFGAKNFGMRLFGNAPERTGERSVGGRYTIPSCSIRFPTNIFGTALLRSMSRHTLRVFTNRRMSTGVTSLLRLMAPAHEQGVRANRGEELTQLLKAGTGSCRPTGLCLVGSRIPMDTLKCRCRTG